MKKILLSLLLLFYVAGYGQIYQNPTFGTVTTKTSPTVTTPAFINTQEATGVNGKIPSAYIAKSEDVQKKSYLSTGLLKNGAILANGDPTKYNISAGIGIKSNFNDPENPVSRIITFPAFTGITPTYLLTGTITYIAIEEIGTSGVGQVFMQSTPFTNEQRRDLIELGAVIHSNLATINVINNISSPSESGTNQLHDLMEFIGALNLTGNKYAANGANLQLNKSAGTIGKRGVNFVNNWKDPHRLSQASGTALTFRYRTQNGTEGSDITSVNPALYDLNNVLTAVPNNKFTIQTVIMFQTGVTRLLYDQNYYDDLEKAKAAIFTRQFVVEPNSKENGLIRAYVIMRNTTTSLQAVADAEILEAQKFGGVASGGVTLTLASVVAALGFTPEDVANKATDFSVVNNTLYPTVQAVDKKIPFVTLEEFGAVGDGAANDYTAIQNAVNSGKNILVGSKTYLSNSTITINNPITIIGAGSLSVFKTTSNQAVFDIKSNLVTLKYFKILGNGRSTGTNYATTRPLQNGIKVDGAYYNATVDHIIFDSLGNSGIYGNNNFNGVSANVTGSVNVNSCLFFNNLFGVNYDTLFEYNLTSDSVFKDNQTAIRVAGGNNPISGGHIMNNRTGVYLTNGSNNSHSTMSDVTINHNIDYGIRAENLSFGYTISNCVLFFNPIDIQGSNAVSIDGGLMKLEANLNLVNNTDLTIQNVKFLTTPTTVATGNTNLRYFNNSYPSGVVPSNMVETIKNLYNLENFDIYATTAANNFIRMRVGGSNRFLLGSDAAITAGNDADFNAYVAGANNYFVSTNGVKRTSVNGSGVFNVANLAGTGSRLMLSSSTGDVSAPSNFTHTGNATFTGTVTALPATVSTELATKGQLDAAVGVVPLKYTALISQSGTSAPTVVIEDNTVGTIVWTRSATGAYLGTLTGAFPLGKTICLSTTASFGGAVYPTIITIGRQNSDSVFLVTRQTDSVGTSVDSAMSNISIKIEVYP